MKSKHLENQLLRMQESFSRNYLIIHGDFNDLYAHPIQSKHFKWFRKAHKIGMLASIAVRYNVKVLQVSNIPQTIDLILKIIEKTDDGKVPDGLELQKKDFTRNPVFLILAALPSVGYKKAEAISKKYASLHTIQVALRQNTFDVEGMGKKTKEYLKEILLQ